MNSFSKIPLPQDKEKKAEDFLNFEDPYRKKPTKVLYLRMPDNYWQELQKIATLSGVSMNAACLELLIPAMQNKLKKLLA